MKTIDPGFTPMKSTTPRQRKKDGLVFLDLGYDDDSPSEPAAKPAATAEPAALEGLELTSMADDGPSEGAPARR